MPKTETVGPATSVAVQSHADAPPSRAMSIRDQVADLIDGVRDQIAANLAASSIQPDRFAAVFQNMVARFPDVLACDRRSVVIAMLNCAQDGLLPDGKRAIVVPYRQNVERKKRRPDGSTYTLKENILVAQYMPMVQGIIQRARELGEVLSFTANPIHELDSFEADETDPSDTKHTRPKLDQPRGKIIGGYCIFRDKAGNVIHREILDAEDIKKIRGSSKAKGGPAWTQWEGEMVRKSAIRRGSKYVPMSDALRAIVERDDAHTRLDAIGQVADRRTAIEATTEGYNPLLETSAAPAADEDDDTIVIDETSDPVTGEVVEGKPVISGDDVEAKVEAAMFTDADGQLIERFRGALANATTRKGVEKAAEDYREALDAASPGVARLAKGMVAARLASDK